MSYAQRADRSKVTAEEALTNVVESLREDNDGVVSQANPSTDQPRVLQAQSAPAKDAVRYILRTDIDNLVMGSTHVAREQHLA